MPNELDGDFDQSEVGFIEQLTEDQAIDPDAPDADLLSELGLELGVDDAVLPEDEPLPDEPEPDIEPKNKPKSPDELPDADDESVPDEEPEDEPEPEPAPEPRGAQKRIRDLIAQRNEAQLQAQQMQAEFNQQTRAMLQQQAAQMQQQFQHQAAQMQEQLQIQQRQLEMLQGNRQEEAEKDLPFVERFKLQTIREARAAVAEERSQELAALRAEFDAYRQQQEQAAAAAESRARYEYFGRQTDRAMREVLFEGLPDEFVAEHGAEFRDALLSIVASKNVDPIDAAKYLRRTFDLTHAARLQSPAKRQAAPQRGPDGKFQKQKPAAKRGAQSVPPTPAPGRRVAKDNRRPSWDQLQAAGYHDYVEWMEDGSPIISK